MEAYHLQDNMSKAVLAAEIVDRELVGAEHRRIAYQREAMRDLERQMRELAPRLEDRPGSRAVSRDQERRRHRHDQERGRQGETDPEEEEPGYSQDLRLRREEDDRGKGERLDISG